MEMNLTAKGAKGQGKGACKWGGPRDVAAALDYSVVKLVLVGVSGLLEILSNLT